MVCITDLLEKKIVGIYIIPKIEERSVWEHAIRHVVAWHFYFFLKSLSFKVNSYGPCIANNILNGSQCTIYFYVDDTHISHKEQGVVILLFKRSQTHAINEKSETRLEIYTIARSLTRIRDALVTIL